jgi:pimeloyl-ACP methyl ester carboxylesterase
MAETMVNGAIIYFEVRGREGEPMIMVHGSWTDHHQWDVAANLLARRFRVLTFDRRGHSLSRRTATPGTRVDEDVMDVAGLIEQQGFAPAHVVGNSFGAIIALRLASCRPDLIRTLIAHEPPLFGLLAVDPSQRTLSAEVHERLDAVIGLLEKGEIRAGAERFVDTVAVGPGGWKQLPPEIQETFVVNAQTFLDETKEPAAFDLPQTGLDRFSRPCLLSQGDQSPPFFGAVLDKLSAVMPDARRKTFTAAGHGPHMSNPAQYASEVMNFILGQASN